MCVLLPAVDAARFSFSRPKACDSMISTGCDPDVKTRLWRLVTVAVTVTLSTCVLIRDIQGVTTPDSHHLWLLSRPCRTSHSQTDSMLRQPKDALDRPNHHLHKPASLQTGNAAQRPPIAISDEKLQAKSPGCLVQSTHAPYGWLTSLASGLFCQQGDPNYGRLHSGGRNRVGTIRRVESAGRWARAMPAMPSERAGWPAGRKATRRVRGLTTSLLFCNVFLNAAATWQSCQPRQVERENDEVPRKCLHSGINWAKT